MERNDSGYLNFIECFQQESIYDDYPGRIWLFFLVEAKQLVDISNRV